MNASNNESVIIVSVRYFASLREQRGCAEEQYTCAADTTAGDLWHTLATEHQLVSESILMAVNHVYVSPQQLLVEGDEVAFFPPVTGG